MSDADNKAVSNVTVAGEPRSLSMCGPNKGADTQTFDSRYREKSQTCRNVELVQLALYIRVLTNLDTKTENLLPLMSSVFGAALASVCWDLIVRESGNQKEIKGIVRHLRK